MFCKEFIKRGIILKEPKKKRTNYKEFDKWKNTFKTKQEAFKQLPKCENYSWNPCFVSEVTTKEGKYYKIFRHETDQNKYLKKLNDKNVKFKNYYTKHYTQRMERDQKWLKLFIIIIGILAIPTILFAIIGDSGLGYDHIQYWLILFGFLSIISIVFILVQIPLPNLDPPNMPLTLASFSHFIIPSWISLFTFFFSQNYLLSFLIPFILEISLEMIEYLGYLYVDWIRKMTEETWFPNRIFDIIMAILGILLALFLMI